MTLLAGVVFKTTTVLITSTMSQISTENLTLHADLTFALWQGSWFKWSTLAKFVYAWCLQNILAIRYNWFCNTKLYMMYTYIALHAVLRKSIIIIIFVKYKCAYSSLFDPPSNTHAGAMNVHYCGTAQEAIFCGQDRPCWPGHEKEKFQVIS